MTSPLISLGVPMSSFLSVLRSTQGPIRSSLVLRPFANYQLKSQMCPRTSEARSECCNFARTCKVCPLKDCSVHCLPSARPAPAFHTWSPPRRVCRVCTHRVMCVRRALQQLRPCVHPPYSFVATRRSARRGRRGIPGAICARRLPPCSKLTALFTVSVSAVHLAPAQTPIAQSGWRAF